MTEVLRPGANDVYVVRGASPRELLIPALRRTVVAVDLEARRITVDPSAGDLPLDALPSGPSD